MSSYSLDISPLLLCEDIVPGNSVAILTMWRACPGCGLTNRMVEQRAEMHVGL